METLRHPEDVTRANIPTSETSGLKRQQEENAKPRLYPRNPDLDPQLVWRGKDEQDSTPLAVDTVPIYIQEKVKPEALIRDLHRQAHGSEAQANLFGDFDRIEDPELKLDFYQHPENWSNRMILGDSLLVMNSLAEKEGLKGQVQMIYLDPPYGIRFASNWQPSTRTREVKEGKAEGVSREPEQIKAFRDTWKDGIHSYLSYLRDRLTVSRELLRESGSVLVQIGDENVHVVRVVMDEIFGPDNFISQVSVKKTSGATGVFLPGTVDFVLWYAKDKESTKYRQLYTARELGIDGDSTYAFVQEENGIRRRATIEELSTASDKTARSPRVFRYQTMTSQAMGREKGEGAASWFPVQMDGREITPPTTSRWKTNKDGMRRLGASQRIAAAGGGLSYIRFHNDFPVFPITDLWSDTQSGSAMDKVYVVQTSQRIVERCLLMTTDPGDLVLDPTCGSGTTAAIAEQWGRRWITVDTSRVALALARTRLMAARHPPYYLRDSPDGAAKEAEITGCPAPDGPFRNDIRQGFVLERVPHVTLKSIANNAEIDLIHDKWQPALDATRAALNATLGTSHQEWEIPRILPAYTPGTAHNPHAQYWQARRDRQKEIDASIVRNADTEFLHDRPYQKRNAVRVTGPFTVESLSPHRVLPLPGDDDPALLDAIADEAGDLPPHRPLRPKTEASAGDDFVTVVMDNLLKAGVQNTKKNERMTFATIRPWPGQGHVGAEGTYEESGQQRRAAIVIGPEYGTVGQDLVRQAVRECRDWADALVVCGFAFDPQVGDSTMNFGRLTVLKARMSQELHAADAYKSGGGNLFTVFGEPDIGLDREQGGACVVRLKGVDIFDPTTGEVRSSKKVEDDIACWFIDTDYDGESFFVRHAYFLGGKDPYEKLKAALRAEIDPDAWATLYRAESRAFPAPKSGQVAVKVINHYGDEAMKVFRVT